MHICFFEFKDILIYCNTAARVLTDITYVRLPRARSARPRESADISVKPRARLCYNIYVTFSVVVYSDARNYPGVTTLSVRYYAVRGYHIGLTSQKLRRRRVARNSRSDKLITCYIYGYSRL